MADLSIALTQAAAMLDEIYDMNVIPQQARFGKTAAMLTNEKKFKGTAMHVKFLNQVLTRTGMTSSLEDDFTGSGRTELIDVKIEESDFRRLDVPLQYTAPAGYLLDGGPDSAWDIANELALQANEAIGERRNVALHADTNGRLALVSAVYNEDGTTYTAGQSDAFIKLKTGSVSAFHEGQLIEIHSGSTATIRNVVKVNDVWHQADYRGLGIGPGIVVTIDSTENTAASGDANLNNVAGDDMIVFLGQLAASNYGMAFATLCNRTTPGAYFSVTDRAAKGYQFLIPYGADYTSSSAAVDLDVDLHFGKFANTLGLLYNKSRNYRRAAGFKLSEAIVGVAQPDLVNEFVRQIGSANSRFTKEFASSMDSAKSMKLVGVAGFNGAVVRFPDDNIPPMALVSEPIAAPNTIRILDPNAFTWYRWGPAAPTWVKSPGSGSMWHVRTSSGNLTMTYQAAGYVIETLFCDQPRVGVYTMEGVKHSL